MRVMIVDDDKEFLEELKETLALSGYEVVEASDSNEAAGIATKTKPDIVVMDLKMPNKSGFQLADEFKHSDQLHNIPLIAMSAFFKEELFPLMKSCGILKCIKKPFNPLDIIAQIENVLKEKEE
ncbi:MAG: response regulator [Candidatus Omnitrophota bacterium]